MSSPPNSGSPSRRHDVFEGRSALLTLADELINVAGGKQVAAGGTRPVLVVEGISGSGRSALLRKICAKWAGETPLVLVSPLDLYGNDDTVRPVLATVMLGLSAVVPRYKVAFSRVLLAEIAMAPPTVNSDPTLAVDEMLERLRTYRESRALVQFIGDLVRAVGKFGTHGNVPIVDEMAPEVANNLAETVEKRLRGSRWLAKLSWQDALAWYGGNNQSGNSDAVRELVRLNWWATNTKQAVRNQVNDELVRALLADLRYSLARSRNRPTNAVVLLDDGDAPSASAFVSSLSRVRQLETDQEPDPLTLITVSGGVLGQDLAAVLPTSSHVKEPTLGELSSAQVRRSGLLLRVCSADLSPEDVLRLTGHAVPGAHLTGEAVHRLTGGHPAATILLLDTLARERELVNDLDAALRAPCLASPQRLALEEHLLQQITTTLSPHRQPSTALLGLLITISAGRDRLEAQSLASLSNATRRERSRLLDSPTLWAYPESGGEPSLPPLVRYLCLRALARRGTTHQASWHRVFTKLRTAVPESDVAGRLHHDLALAETPEQTAAVASELAELLPVMPAEDWVALLDSVVAIPDPRRLSRAADLIGEGGPRPGTVARLLEVLHVLSDRCLSDQNTLCRLYQLAEHDYDQLADSSTNAVVLIRRAAFYRRLADALL